MKRTAAVIGAGMGGLTAAIRLAQQGLDVTVFEARDRVGGLAGGESFEGLDFDAGPYILLDRAGLDWAFQQLGLSLTEEVSLTRIDRVYEVVGDDRPVVEIRDSLDETVAGLETHWPDVGAKYRSFAQRTQRIYEQLQPLQWVSAPGLREVLRCGAWRHVPFLFRSLRSVLERERFPPQLNRALAVWTHVAGQSLTAAPSPLALVPSRIHSAGAWYPDGGIRSIPHVLAEKLRELGGSIRLSTAVRAIRLNGQSVAGIELSDGEQLNFEFVVSDVGLKTLLQLIDSSVVPERERRRLQALPLQSPGVCVFLAVRQPVSRPYLTFRLFDEPDGCRLLILPSAMRGAATMTRTPSADTADWLPARLLAPMNHARARQGGEEAQRRFLDRVLSEDWWRHYFQEGRVLSTRIPLEWGSAFYLWQNSMNPVMTAALMRRGRLSHCCPWVKGLYLAGSATHPGQWVSFAAVSGVLAANRLIQHLGAASR